MVTDQQNYKQSVTYKTNKQTNKQIENFSVPYANEIYQTMQLLLQTFP